MTPAEKQTQQGTGECGLTDGGDQKTGDGAASAQGDEDDSGRHEDDGGFEDRVVARGFMCGSHAGRAAGGVDPERAEIEDEQAVPEKRDVEQGGAGAHDEQREPINWVEKSGVGEKNGDAVHGRPRRRDAESPAWAM